MVATISQVGSQKSGRPLVSAETVPLSELRKAASQRHLYAILDACDAPVVPPKVNELGEENGVSLYRGEAEEDYWAIAPYLVRVDAATLEWIIAALWKEPWGVFAVADSTLELLRTHFRKILIAELPDSKKVYFRFYDPRVLRLFLPTCTDEQIKEFFGPVRSYLANGEGGDSLEQFLGPLR